MNTFHIIVKLQNNLIAKSKEVIMKTDRIIFALYLLANLIYITIEKNKIISKREMIGDQSAIYQKRTSNRT